MCEGGDNSRLIHNSLVFGEFSGFDAMVRFEGIAVATINNIVRARAIHRVFPRQTRSVEWPLTDDERIHPLLPSVGLREGEELGCTDSRRK